MLRIIGAGLPRTATLTQKIALEMLGEGPCYHMVTVLGDLDRVPLWQQALDGKPCWDDIFAGFSSTVDWPGSFFYRELIDVYPAAKVLLSVRDPDNWARSMLATVVAANRGDSFMRHLSQARALVDPDWHAYSAMTSAMLFAGGGLIGSGCDDETAMAVRLRAHVAEVKATVPAERLLVWAPADGWAPLCDFLEIAIPEAPFPHVNDRDAFEDRVVESSLNAVNHYWDQHHPPG